MIDFARKLISASVWFCQLGIAILFVSMLISSLLLHIFSTWVLLTVLQNGETTPDRHVTAGSGRRLRHYHGSIRVCIAAIRYVRCTYFKQSRTNLTPRPFESVESGIYSLTEPFWVWNVEAYLFQMLPHIIYTIKPMHPTFLSLHKKPRNFFNSHWFF